MYVSAEVAVLVLYVALGVGFWWGWWHRGVDVRHYRREAQEWARMWEDLRRRR